MAYMRLIYLIITLLKLLSLHILLCFHLDIFNWLLYVFLRFWRLTVCQPIFSYKIRRQKEKIKKKQNIFYFITSLYFSGPDRTHTKNKQKITNESNNSNSREGKSVCKMQGVTDS